MDVANTSVERGWQQHETCGMGNWNQNWSQSKLTSPGTVRLPQAKGVVSNVESQKPCDPGMGTGFPRNLAIVKNRADSCKAILALDGGFSQRLSTKIASKTAAVGKRRAGRSVRQTCPLKGSLGVFSKPGCQGNHVSRGKFKKSPLSKEEKQLTQHKERQNWQNTLGDKKGMRASELETMRASDHQ